MDYDGCDLPFTDGITDPEEILRRVRGEVPPPIPTPPGGWAANPAALGAEIRRLADLARPIIVRLPR